MITATGHSSALLQPHVTTMFNDWRDQIPDIRPPRKAKVKPVAAPAVYDHKALYLEAHRYWFERTYPQAYQAGQYHNTTLPPLTTSNGLTRAVINYLTWYGHNADRTGTQGRMIKDKAGNYKRINSANRKGTADVSATILGRAVKLEIKVGRDKPSEHQLREQARERAAGGVYQFVYGFDQFITWYENFILQCGK